MGRQRSAPPVWGLAGFVAAALPACASGGAATPDNVTTDGCVATSACTCAAGESAGLDSCGGACSCASEAGNVDSSVPFSAPDARPVDWTPGEQPPGGCEPGLYLGTYECTVDVGAGPVPLTGTVSFELMVNEQVVESDSSCQEFCQDLVIAEGDGTLFGVVLGGLGFQAGLGGGLDCQTGEFRAESADGIYGLPAPNDPNDPEGQWSVAAETGTFVADLQGMHEATETPARMTGTWRLQDMWTGIECMGPFEVTLTE